MKIVLVVIGKTSEQYLIDGILEYKQRLKHYINFEIKEIPNLKKRNTLTAIEITKREGELILNQLVDSDYVVLLDDKGKHYTSLAFAKRIQSLLLSGKKRIVFVVGGALGFSDQVMIRAEEQLSLSKMTFSHQMVRLFFLEQVYRGFTILNNQPYHNE